MSDYFDRVERQIAQRVEAGAARRGLPFRPALSHLATVAAVLVVVVVAGVFLLARGGRQVSPEPSSPTAVRVFLSAPSGASPAAIERSAQILGRRLADALPQAHVSVSGGGIVVTAAGGPSGVRSRVLALSAPGRLAFYDWEADVLAPDGSTVASQLPSPDPSVIAISQGNGSAAPGELGAGCMSLADAVALAAQAGAGQTLRIEHLGNLPLRVPVGYTVLQAAPLSPGGATDGYFVLRARPAMSNGAILDPAASSDPNTRAPDVTFSFTSSGRRAFQAVTAAIARRGGRVSSPGNSLNQHFAVALDNRLITVPYIDFKQYPDGISGEDGADITAGFTKRSAQDLAILLRYGPLPVNLTATG